MEDRVQELRLGQVSEGVTRKDFERDRAACENPPILLTRVITRVTTTLLGSRSRLTSPRAPPRSSSLALVLVARMGRSPSSTPSASARRRAARLVCFGFDGLEMNDHARSMIDAGCGAVIIFARNIATPAQVASLTAAMKRRAAPRPLLVMVDQEGGRVARFRAPRFTDIPSARRVGRSPDPVRAATVVGDVVARELRATGVDMTLAPVVDVDTNPECVVIGDRAFATEPDAVGDAAVAFIEAAQKAGAATCAKHWPGHGDVREDSHDALPASRHGLDRLESVELAPFRAAISANVASALVAHLLVPAMEPEAHRPASCSERCVTYLRKNLRFGDGVVMTDDMEMGALRGIPWPAREGEGGPFESGAVPRAATEGLRAGIDLFLACHTRRLQLDVIEALTIAIERDESAAAKARKARRRLDALCAAYVSAAPPGKFGTPGPTTSVDAVKGTATVAAAMGESRGRL